MARKTASPAAASAAPESPVVIRDARPGDEAEISRLIHALALYEKAPQDCICTPAMVREQLFCANPVAFCVLAEIDGQIVGFALYFRNFSTWLCQPGMYLEDLFVDPEHRKRGVGTLLLKHLGRICLERGYKRFEWACLEWNELAKGRYRNIGAFPMEDWRTWRLAGEALRKFGSDAPPAPASARSAKAAPAAPAASASAKAKKPGKRAALADAPDLFNSTAAAPPPESCVAAKVSAAAKEAPPAKPAGKPRFVIHTDGGCQPNPGVGAWAAVIRGADGVKDLVGGDDNTTNNQMELMGAIMALESLKEPSRVEFHTDSQYVKNGITSWIDGWKRKGWISSTKEPVKNADLWRRLDAARSRHEVEWKWVRGHAGTADNERCDELCGAEIRRRYKERNRW